MMKSNKKQLLDLAYCPLELMIDIPNINKLLIFMILYIIFRMLKKVYLAKKFFKTKVATFKQDITHN